MADQELLPDPGFEGNLSGWQITGDQVATIAGDNVAVYSGAQSMRVGFTDVGLSAATMMIHGLEINRSYRVSAWMFCPQDSDSLAPSIRVSWDMTWEEAPATWVEHPEAWTDYALQDSASEVPFEVGVWALRELVFAAPHDYVRVEFYNSVPAVAGQSFNVDEASVAFDVPRLPDVYCELASEWTTVPVMNVIGENFIGGMQTYREVDHFEPDRITPISPATYTGIQEDYTSYADILSNASYVVDVVRIDPGGLESGLQYQMPIPIEHGGFRLIDVEAPLDVYFHYRVRLDNGLVMSTQDCIIPVYTIADFADMHCSPVLLSDPLVASQSMWVGLISIDALTHAGRRELFDIISRRYPVGLSDIRMAPRTSIKVVTKTLDQRTDFLNLVAPSRVLLLRIPDTRYPEAYCYLSIGDIVEERIIHFDHRRPERRWTLDVALVERPHGLVSFTSNRVYNDVLNFEPDGVTSITPQTYQGIIFDYSDYTSVLVGENPQLVGIGELLPPPAPDALGQWVLVRP